MRRARFFGLIMLWPLFLLACGQPSRPARPRDLPLPPAPFAWPDWSHPLGQDASIVRVRNDAQAQALVHFELADPPTEWGTPAFLDVGAPDTSGERESVAWMYEDESGEALYLMIQSSPPSMDQPDLEASATCGIDEAACQQQNFSLVDLGDGRNALQVTGDVALVLVWLQGKTEFILAGPLETFAPATALKMAWEL